MNKIVLSDLQKRQVENALEGLLDNLYDAEFVDGFFTANEPFTNLEGLLDRINDELEYGEDDQVLDYVFDKFAKCAYGFDNEIENNATKEKAISNLKLNLKDSLGIDLI